MLGAAVAHALAERGRRVVVLERDAPNRAGSGTTAGNLHIQVIHARRPGQLVPVDTRRFLPLQIAASRRWERLDEELEHAIELRRSGGFTVAETPPEVAELEAKLEVEREHGLATELLRGDDLRAAVPNFGDSVAAATFCAADGYANPLLVTPALLAAARRRGAEVRAFEPVTGIEARSGRWEVRTARGAWSTPWVVNVSGPWLSHVCALAGIDLAMAPVALQMHATARTDAMLENLVQHIGDGLSVKRVSAGNVLIGGGWPAALDLEGRSAPTMGSMLGNLALAHRILPFLAEQPILRVWAGPVAATPDEMPIIGEVPECPGFVVAGGTYSFTLAPLWARVVRAIVLGEAPPLPVDDLGPARLLRDGGALTVRARPDQEEVT